LAGKVKLTVGVLAIDEAVSFIIEVIITDRLEAGEVKIAIIIGAVNEPIEIIIKTIITDRLKCGHREAKEAPITQSILARIAITAIGAVGASIQANAQAIAQTNIDTSAIPGAGRVGDRVTVL
jgi:hypothetical protein